MLRIIRDYFSSPNRLWKTKEKRILIENFLSLSALQGISYLLPLLTLPYLVRVLGTDKYGLIAFAQAFIFYFVILTDYGFNLSATQKISIHRDDGKKVGEIFSNVLCIKFIFMVLSLIILIFVVVSLRKFRGDSPVYLLYFGSVLGSVLFPLWFFQGMERMKFITVLSFTSRLLFTLCIFVFVKKASDYLLVPVFYSLGSLVAGILSLVIVFRRFKIELQRPTLVNIKSHLAEGWHVFLYTGVVTLYTISNTFILGLLTNLTIVAYFSAAEKIVRGVMGLHTPIYQAVYPHISRLLTRSKQEAVRLLEKVLLLAGVSTFLFGLGFLIFAQTISRIALGPLFEASIVVFQVLAFLPFVSSFSNVLGIDGLLNLGYKKEFTRYVVQGGIINILLAFIFVPSLKHTGMCLAIMLTELYVSFSMTIFYFRRKKEILTQLGNMDART